MTTKLCTTILHLGLVGTILAGALSTDAAEPQPQFQWLRQFYFGTNQFEAVRALAADASGVYAAGQCGSEYATDAFVQKRDATGAVLWSKFLATSRSDAGYAIAVDSSGVYVGGYAGGALPGQTFVGGDDDAVVRKYDLDGNEVWTREFGSKTPGIENYGRDHVLGITLTADAVYVVGASEGPLPGQTWLLDWDAFVRKYDKNGVEQWTRQFGTTYGESANAIAADTSGVYVLGHGGAPVDRWQMFLRKYDPDGTLLWSQQFGDPNTFQAPGGIAVDGSGVYVYGSTRGTIPGQTSSGGEDNFIRKYTTAGVELWTHQFGTSANDNGGGVALNSTGLYVVGTTWGAFPGYTNAGGADALVQKFDPNGNELWTLQFGTSGNDPLTAIALGYSGLYVGAYTYGTFPGQTSGGSLDAYVAKLQRAPNANAGSDLTFTTSNQSGATVPGAASDPDHDTLSYQWFEGTTALTTSQNAGTNGECPLDISTLSLGEHVLTLKVTDTFFEVQDSMTLQVVDDTAPTLSPIADESYLWPPKHQMVLVNITANATDNSGGALNLAVSISCNEPVDGLGDGDTSPDWETVSINQATGAIVIRLRAERSGSGSGRIYTVTVSATDSAGNTGQSQVTILAPLVQAKG